MCLKTPCIHPTVLFFSSVAPWSVSWNLTIAHPVSFFNNMYHSHTTFILNWRHLSSRSDWIASFPKLIFQFCYRYIFLTFEGTFSLCSADVLLNTIQTRQTWLTFQHYRNTYNLRQHSLSNSKQFPRPLIIWEQFTAFNPKTPWFYVARISSP